MSSEPRRNRLRSVVGLALFAALFAGAWFVMDALRRSTALENCYASGRRDCVTIDANGAHANRR